jgi:hypothetical protein
LIWSFAREQADLDASIANNAGGDWSSSHLDTGTIGVIASASIKRLTVGRRFYLPADRRPPARKQVDR